eukprot:5729839-Pyramimonas_sp.AAC.1
MERGKWTNKSFGFAFLLNVNLGPAVLRQTYYPLAYLQGGVAGIRLTASAYDYALFVCYYAPTHVKFHSTLGQNISKLAGTTVRPPRLPHD